MINESENSKQNFINNRHMCKENLGGKSPLKKGLTDTSVGSGSIVIGEIKPKETVVDHENIVIGIIPGSESISGSIVIAEDIHLIPGLVIRTTGNIYHSYHRTKRNK